jgi:hypothetical protein
MSHECVLVLGDYADFRFSKFIIDSDKPESTYKGCLFDGASWERQIPTKKGKLVSKTLISHVDLVAFQFRMHEWPYIERILLLSDKWYHMNDKVYKPKGLIEHWNVWPELVIKCLEKQDPNTKITLYNCHS